MYITIVEGIFYVDLGCKNIFESKRVHLSSKGFDLDGTRVQRHI